MVVLDCSCSDQSVRKNSHFLRRDDHLEDTLVIVQKLWLRGRLYLLKHRPLKVHTLANEEGMHWRKDQPANHVRCRVKTYRISPWCQEDQLSISHMLASITTSCSVLFSPKWILSFLQICEDRFRDAIPILLFFFNHKIMFAFPLL